MSDEYLKQILIARRDMVINIGLMINIVNPNGNYYLESVVSYEKQ